MVWTEQKQKILRRGGKNTQKNCTKKIFMTQIITMAHLEQTSWNASQGGLRKHHYEQLVEVMEFQLSYFKSWKMMLWKRCTKYASKFGKLFSGHRTGKGQFSFQSQRKAMPKNAQTTAQLHSSHTLAEWCPKFSKQASTVHELGNSRCSTWV